jgi:protein O-mannosyl-transferase
MASRSPVGLVAALVLAALLTHARSLGFGFSPLDDRLLILDRVAWLADPAHVPAAFQEGVFLGKERNFYRPLLTVSFIPDTWLGGGSPRTYHATNVLLHALATALVFAALSALGVRRGAAFALALVFAVHPVLAHAVDWIPGRNDTLLAVWVLSAFLCFEKSRRGGGAPWAAACALCLLLALLTKETAILLVPVLLLRSAKWKQLGRLAIGWAAALAAWCALLVIYGASSLRGPSGSHPGMLREFGLAMIVLYGKLVLPLEQSVVPVLADSPLVPGLLALAVTVLAVWRWGVHDARVAAFGCAWFIAFLALPTLAGSSGVVMPIHHEHRLYLPAFGLLAIVGQLRVERPKAWPAWLPQAAVALLVVVLGARTVARSAVYRDPLSFAEDAVRHSPSNALSYRLRGDVELDQNHGEQAIADYQRALELRPGHAGALSNLGKAYYLTGRPAAAIEAYTQAIHGEPEELEHYNNRGIVYLMTGDLTHAVADLDFVLARDPRNSKALNNRGKALTQLGRYAQARDDLAAAIALNPRDGEAYHNRAVAYYFLKDYERAWADVAAARSVGIVILPDFLDALRRASGRDG